MWPFSKRKEKWIVCTDSGSKTFDNIDDALRYKKINDEVRNQKERDVLRYC